MGTNSIEFPLEYEMNFRINMQLAVKLGFGKLD